MRRYLCGISSASWKGIALGGIKVLNLELVLTGLRVQCFSARRSRTSKLPKVSIELPAVASPLPKATPLPSMKEESDAFYVVRKGDIVGIYKSLRECQAQVSSSVYDPSVSVYKGYSLCKDTEEYLASRGLKNSLYTIDASDLKDNLFEALVPCPFQEPDGLALLCNTSDKKAATLKRPKELEASESGSTSYEKSKKHHKLGSNVEAQLISQNSSYCILEFDGASKGNPGKAGAGAILRTKGGSVICRLRQGLGNATCNVAEYRALILGLKHAIMKGFKQIEVQGDSKLVCKQVMDLWEARNENMVSLLKEVKGLKESFQSFCISHVKREFNSDADAQANLAVNLPMGEIYEEPG